MANTIIATKNYVDRKFEELRGLLEKEDKDDVSLIRPEPMMLRSVQFVEHPVLQGLKLDFCNADGEPSDTIIFAGENGTGKSTIISSLDDVMSRRYSIKQKINWVAD